MLGVMRLVPSSTLLHFWRGAGESRRCGTDFYLRSGLAMEPGRRDRSADDQRHPGLQTFLKEGHQRFEATDDLRGRNAPKSVCRGALRLFFADVLMPGPGHQHQLDPHWHCYTAQTCRSCAARPTASRHLAPRSSLTSLRSPPTACSSCPIDPRSHTIRSDREHARERRARRSSTGGRHRRAATNAARQSRDRHPSGMGSHRSDCADRIGDARSSSSAKPTSIEAVRTIIRASRDVIAATVRSSSQRQSRSLAAHRDPLAVARSSPSRGEITYSL